MSIVAKVHNIRQQPCIFDMTAMWVLFYVMISVVSCWTTTGSTKNVIQIYRYHQISTTQRYTTLDGDNEIILCKRNELLTKNLMLTPRRNFLKQCSTCSTIVTTSIIIGSTSQPCNAGEIGRQITEAITTSELGISVRRSVVRGAQIMDQIDLQSERLSDTYQLGSERSKQSKRPKPKFVPPIQSLDTNIAIKIINTIDDIFCHVTQIPKSILQTQIQIVTNTVLPSFVRSGVQILSNNNNNNNNNSNNNDDINININTATAATNEISMESGLQFNFAMYVHYKSYTDLLVTEKKQRTTTTKNFGTFQKTFETQIGHELLSILIPSSDTTITKTISNKQNDQVQAFYDALQRIDQLSTILVKKGFVAQIDRTQFDVSNGNNNNVSDSMMDITDWSQQISDLSFSVALEYDITLSSQILLQEQGIRLYPNYIRCMIQSILQQELLPYRQRIITEDYYLDTDYNSDPDKFEVKEVLININIENTVE
jgi:hypothetical protein